MALYFKKVNKSVFRLLTFLLGYFFIVISGCKSKTVIVSAKEENSIFLQNDNTHLVYNETDTTKLKGNLNNSQDTILFDIPLYGVRISQPIPVKSPEPLEAVCDYGILPTHFNSKDTIIKTDSLKKDTIITPVEKPIEVVPIYGVRTTIYIKNNEIEENRFIEE